MTFPQGETDASPLASGRAPGKIILFGEHAVVYGRPAIAAPVFRLQAEAVVYPDPEGVCRVEALDIGQQVMVATAGEDDPFARLVRLVCTALDRPLPPWRMVIRSEIPVASGLGSGAAVATAMARALLAAFGVEWSAAAVSALVYEVEKLHHGTPSGIDNTVIAYGRPVWFVRGQPPMPFAVGAALDLLIGDTGIASPTRLAVADVRRGWEADPSRFEALFDRIAAIVHEARTALAEGDRPRLGALMDANQEALAALGVSSPELERLCAAARAAGAWGAKLSGGGRGGNMIALVDPDRREPVTAALLAAGAHRVVHTTLTPTAQ
ncbi:MAG: mevalonate kinase [Caldilineales bacterium]|nr:mevalonate kinase [Caldilineales bacterium]